MFQVCLGGIAFYTRVVQGHDALQPQLPMVISTVAHVGTGALLLAATVILTIRAWLIRLQPAKRLRVAGNVQLGSIKRSGTHVQFVLVEQDQLLSVDYTGTEAPPDTFKDDSQALADGTLGHHGVFHAKALQAKCASKYAPQKPGNQIQAEPAKRMTRVQTGSQPTAASN